MFGNGRHLSLLAGGGRGAREGRVVRVQGVLRRVHGGDGGARRGRLALRHPERPHNVRRGAGAGRMRLPVVVMVQHRTWRDAARLGERPARQGPFYHITLYSDAKIRVVSLENYQLRSCTSFRLRAAASGRARAARGGPGRDKGMTSPRWAWDRRAAAGRAAGAPTAKRRATTRLSAPPTTIQLLTTTASAVGVARRRWRHLATAPAWSSSCRQAPLVDCLALKKRRNNFPRWIYMIRGEKQHKSPCVDLCKFMFNINN